MTSSWGYAVWALLAVGVLGLWALSHTSSGRRLVARPSVVLARLAGDRWLRVVVLVAWGWVGWHLFAR